MILPLRRTRSRSRSWLPALALALLLSLWPAATASAAPAWLAPADLSGPGPELAPTSVATDPAGDAVAVWQTEEGAGGIVQSSSRPAGGRWSAPADLSAPGEDASGGLVAIDGAGDAVAVWEVGEGSDRTVQSASLPLGGGWSAPVDISPPGQRSSDPRVAIDSAGAAVAVWLDSASGRIQSADLPLGGRWSSPTGLSGADASEPALSVDEDGAAVAAWDRQTGEGPSGVIRAIEVSERPVGGRWGSATEISGAEEYAHAPQVAIDAIGDVVAVWRYEEDGVEVVQSAGHRAGGRWDAPVDVSTPGSEAGENALQPQVAIDAAGEAVAVWERYEGLYGVANVIQASTRPAGGGWGAPVDLSSSGENNRPRLATDAAGDTVAAWAHVTGSSELVQAAGRQAGGAWSTTADLSAPDKGSDDPLVAIDAEGNAVAIWRTNDGTDLTVQAAGYDAAGPRLGALSIPGGGTVGSPISFSVSPFDVWSSPGPVSWSFGDGSSVIGEVVSHTFSAPGTYRVSVDAADVLGNASSASGTVVVDAPPAVAPVGEGRKPAAVRPKVTLRYTPNRRHRRNPRGGPRYTFRFFDRTPEATFYCRLDGARFRPCSSPMVYRHLRPGRHVFRVKSIDAAGEKSPVDIVHFAAGRRRHPR